MALSWTPLALLALLAAPPALAQPAPRAPAPPSPAPQRAELEEVEVTGDRDTYRAADASTGTRLDAPLIETPVSVQVVPQQVLQDQQAITVEQALENVSGVYVRPAAFGTANVSIRGFVLEDYYADGAHTGAGTLGLPPPDAIQYERVEVLKGPASILYGRMEPGGLVNAVGKVPLRHVQAALGMVVGSYGLNRTTLDSTGPLVESGGLAYRVTAAATGDATFRPGPETGRLFLAPVVQWEATERLTIKVGGELGDERMPGPLGQIPVVNGRPLALPRGETLLEPSDGTWANHNLRGWLAWSYALGEGWSIEQRVDAYRLRSGQSPSSYILDFDPDTGLVNRHLARATYFNGETYTAHLNLKGRLDTWGAAHSLLVGVDGYWKWFATENLDWDFPSIDPLAPVHFPDLAAATGAPQYRNVFNNRDLSLAAFAQDQVRLPFGVVVLAGLRHEQAGTRNASSFVDLLQDPAVTTDSRDSQREHGTTWRLGALWRPRDELSLYASYVTNFGLNNGRQVDGRPLPPQTGQQVEAGVKSELLDRRLSATLAAYTIWKQNLPKPDPNFPGTGFVVPVGEVRSRGLELDVTGAILPGWSVIASAALIQAIITKDRVELFDDAGTSIGFGPGNTGNDFFGTPRVSGSLWTTCALRGEGWRGPKLGAGVVYRGRQYGDDANTYRLPGYFLVSAMAAYDWNWEGRKLTAQVNLDNLLDKTYFTGANTNLVDVGAPRQVLGSLRLEL